MKEPLSTCTTPRSVAFERWFRYGLLNLVFLLGSFHLATSQNISRTECQCLNNATNDSNGQFAENITIEDDPGSVWIVESAVGIFDASASMAPPADPVPFPENYQIPETAMGVFSLEGIRVTGETWSLTLRKGAIVIDLTSAHTCTYPPSVLIGDNGTCIESIETYEIDRPNTELENVMWSLSGGGTILSGQGSNRIFVLWGDVEGSFEVSVSGQATSYDGQSQGLCDFDITESVDIMDEEAIALACNNQVNISLNGNCELDITADMVLEDMMFSNESYDLIFRDIEADTLISGPTIDMDYINKIVEVKVVHECSGNSCWGNLLLEDKSIPNLDCGDDITIDCDELMGPESTGFPVGVDVTVIPDGNNKYLLIGFDLCSDAELRYEDEVISENLCQGPFSSIVRRRWRVEDNSGNVDTCSQDIFINRASIDDIEFPESYDDVLGPNPSLEACGNFPTLPNGYPDPSFTGEPTGVFCLNAHVEYEDVELPKCGDESYKLRRRWTVRDHCTGESRAFTQNITVVDRTDPSCSAPAPFTVGATELSCSSIIHVPAPEVEDCSSWTYDVSYKPVEPGGNPFFQPSNEGVIQGSDGHFIITDLPSAEGDVWILYYITDACGNMSTCFTTVTVVDDIQPIPVCDLHTFVALNEDGIGYAGVDAFDDGSWDNCGIEKLEARRMANFACGESSQWKENIKFCCADVGNITMVQLRVTDRSGNSNVCMVEVEVQDNHAPVITCPARVTIDCDDDTVNLDQYGNATAEDNCSVDITSTSTRNLNSCGVGFITRRFTATDDQGNTDFCTQRIDVVAQDPFYINPNNPNDPTDDVVWPGPVTLANGCASSGLHPDELPAGRQRPVILSEGCSQVSFSYDDVVFQYTDEACVKVLRTWTVLDHCVYTPFSNVGKWTYTQVIKVENATAPTIEEGCAVNDYEITTTQNCTANISGLIEATDDCTDDAALIYSYRVDVDNNGSFDRNRNGQNVNENVPFGTHRLRIEVEDECGNVQDCDVIITVRDNKPPTPYCLSEIVTVVMESNGEVTIWASDFDNGSFDNCSDSEDLIASFSSNTNDTARTFDCDDLTSTSTSIDVEVYITDTDGNQDFCVATLIVQDNQNFCELEENEGRIALGGHIVNNENKEVPGIAVQLTADLPEFPLLTYTDDEGGYVFDYLTRQSDYELRPYNNDDPSDGVSTLDLVLVQRHILGIEPFESPYHIIAADVNGSDHLSASDLLTLRKMILGIIDEFPGVDSWRFIDKSHTFDEPQSPFPYPLNMQMYDLEDAYMAADFVAVKTGDVNNSSGLFGEQITPRSSVSLTLEDVYLPAGTHNIPLTLEGANEILGMQFEMVYNTDLIDHIQIVSDALQQDQWSSYSTGNALRLSAAFSEAIDMQDQTIELQVTLNKGAQLSDLFTYGNFDHEVYTVSNDVIQTKRLSLNYNHSVANDHYQLLQNIPNPFHTNTEISFVLPARQEATIQVFDINGTRLYTQTSTFNEGLNSIVLNQSDLNATGMLYYQLSSGAFSETKRMIVIQ